MVVPIFKDDQVVKVLDIDSPSVARFTQEDLVGLEQVVKALELCEFLDILLKKEGLGLLVSRNLEFC